MGKRATETQSHRGSLCTMDFVIVEVKAVERLDEIHMAQMLTYLRVTGLHIGLILNFNSAVLSSQRNPVRYNSVSLCLCGPLDGTEVCRR
jgi:GxxExxY protein